MADFFALEAGEYLERLDALLSPEGAPAVDEFVRLSRALRGSALMASQTPIARAAAGIESLARALREGRRGWDPGSRQVAVRAVDDLKILVRRVAAWGDADTAKAEALARDLEQLSGRPSAAIRTAESMGLDAGARAFVAREGAAIASALDRAATATRAGAPARDPLQHVLRALQPLRGLAALNDLPPLPDVLEGIERAVTEFMRTPPGMPSAAADFFQSAATAIAQAAREVAERGRPDPEGQAFRAFTAQLARYVEREPAVVSITDLYFDDTGPHIVQRGAGAAQAAPLSRMELVSHGEHLRLAADAIERAPSATQRELRVHTLAGTFRALAVAGEGPLPQSLSRFVDAAREAVAMGHAVRDPARFAAALRRASELLAESGAADDPRLAAGLVDVTTALHTLAATPAPAPPPGPPAVTSPAGGVPELEELAELAIFAELEAPAIPIEDLAPEPPPMPVAPVIPVAPVAPVAPVRPRRPPMPPLILTERSEVPAETPDIVGSWLVYERMVADGVGPASLDVLMGEPEPVTAFAVAEPEPALATAPPPPPPEPPQPSLPPQPPDLSVVEVNSLLYRGHRALARAQELRELAKRASPEALPALFDEVCDLVVLALEPGV
jgi:hypothetical protein